MVVVIGCLQGIQIGKLESLGDFSTDAILPGLEEIISAAAAEKN